MTQRTNGWRSVLSLPGVYRAAQGAIGSNNVRRVLVERYLRPEPGQRVLDIGCGTGDLLSWLPDIDYLGHDPSLDYIDAARSKFGADGTFVVGGVGEVEIEPATFDAAVAKGVLHHLDDETARALFAEAARALRPGGRLVTIDPAYLVGQSPIARFLASRDRGRNVRTADQYRALVPESFFGVEVVEHHDLLRVPYSHAVMVLAKR